MPPTREEIAEAVRLLQRELDAGSDEIRKVLDDFDADARRARLEEMETKKREAAERRVARLATLGAKPTPARIHAILKGRRPDEERVPRFRPASAAGGARRPATSSTRKRTWSTSAGCAADRAGTPRRAGTCATAAALSGGRSPRAPGGSGCAGLRARASRTAGTEQTDARRLAAMNKATEVLRNAGYAVESEPRLEWKDGARVTVGNTGRLLVTVKEGS